MSAIASYTTAVCAAALVALLPASSRADTSSRLLPVLSQRWAPLKLEGALLMQADVLPGLEVPRLPPALDPAALTWWTERGRGLPLKLELSHSKTLGDDGPRTVDLLAGLNLPNAVPPLIRYSDDETDLTLSLSPGSPCTAACLKFAGSF
jgi:hypothetical protein